MAPNSLFLIASCIIVYIYHLCLQPWPPVYKLWSFTYTQSGRKERTGRRKEREEGRREGGREEGKEKKRKKTRKRSRGRRRGNRNEEFLYIVHSASQTHWLQGDFQLLGVSVTSKWIIVPDLLVFQNSHKNSTN